jgi:glucose-1-phosphate adenylyltransferase
MRSYALAMVLAGGEGKRLAPLTADRAKPAVPFAGHYRLIDFALSNLVNAGFLRIVVLTQYKSHSLDRHISQTWRLAELLGQYVTPVPAQMRKGPRWFAGSADAVYQNLNLVHDERPRHVLVFGADHIYRMDARQMLDQHVATGAGVTVAGIRVPIEQATAFGVIESDRRGRIRAFREKPSDPAGLPDSPQEAFASMGNYIFSTEALVDAVTLDAGDQASNHDIGGDIIPALVEAGDAHVYDFSTNEVPGVSERERGYWRDVGTLDAYYDAHMDLVTAEPTLDLHNTSWPIYSGHDPYPPAKFVRDRRGHGGRAVDSLISGGAVIAGGSVRNSVVSPFVRVGSGAVVEGSVLMHGVAVAEGAVVRRAIIDKNVLIPAGTGIGLDLDADRERYTVSDNGIVVIGKNEKVLPQHV